VEPFDGPKGKTEDIAAKKAGLGSRGTYLRMRVVLERDGNVARKPFVLAEATPSPTLA